MEAGTPDRGLLKISVHNTVGKTVSTYRQTHSHRYRLDHEDKGCWLCTLGTSPTEMLTYGEYTTVLRMFTGALFLRVKR